MRTLFYSVIRHESLAVLEEPRKLGVVVVDAENRTLTFQCAPIRKRIGGNHEDACWVRENLRRDEAILKLMLEHEGIRELARWMRSSAERKDDAMRYDALRPSMVETEDLWTESVRLLCLFTGHGPEVVRQTTAEKVRDQVLANHNLRGTFRPESFDIGVMRVRYSHVHVVEDRPFVLMTHDFAHEVASEVFNTSVVAAEKFRCLRASIAGAKGTIIVTRPRRSAAYEGYRAAVHKYMASGVEVVDADENQLVESLKSAGILGSLAEMMAGHPAEALA
jgi:hypothetical protein